MDTYKRRSCRARRFRHVDNLPEWLLNVLYTALGGLGALFIGLLRANSDNRRTRADDRSNFTDQVMRRLAAVEKQMREERDHSDNQMRLMKEDYEQRIDKRDAIIADLRERDANREERLHLLEELVHQNGLKL